MLLTEAGANSGRQEGGQWQKVGVDFTFSAGVCCHHHQLPEGGDRIDRRIQSEDKCLE